MATPIKLSQNQILLKEGENSNSMYWVQSGQLIVTKQRGKDEVTLGHICSGELVGEISFLDQEPRSATVKALTECELIQIPQEMIDAIYKSQPKWLEILVKTLAERLRKTNARIKV
jgi:CRP/FNR family cyclic AMP-dependent transcriptional regulator